jgi:predicted enzyme related to lactoylglutathione lyase
MFLGLRSAFYSIPAGKLPEATAWYAAVAGKPPYFEQPFYVGFEIGGFGLGLVPDDRAGPGGTLAAWGVPDVAAEIERLVALGAAVEEPATDVGDGIVSGAVRDPFGNRIGLLFNPHFTRP